MDTTEAKRVTEPDGLDHCPHCGGVINAAAIMGARSKGKAHHITEAERERRRLNMLRARTFRRVARPVEREDKPQ